jgi:hypothetical protein
MRTNGKQTCVRELRQELQKIEGEKLRPSLLL